MTTKQKWLRVLFGAIVVIAVLGISFSFIMPWLNNWGSTASERQLTYPSDGLQDQPMVNWHHAITINAPVDQVYPWIAQMADSKAGFYSYTFIENVVSPEVKYHNANRIIPEYQNPKVGEDIIYKAMRWEEIKPGDYMFAKGYQPDVSWTWVWKLVPQGQSTRMLVRMGIQVPPAMNIAPMTFIMNGGAFIMERNMMEGVKDRAEGRFEPSWIEIVEIALWFIALVCGILSAVKFINSKTWLLPISLGVASILVILYLTFGQPAIWIRVVLDALLVAGVVQIYRRK